MSHKTSLVLYIIRKTNAAGCMQDYHKSSDCFQYRKKSLPKSSCPKNTCQNFRTQKNPKIKHSKPHKIPRSSLLLEIQKSRVQSLPILGLSHLLSIYVTQCITLVKCWRPWDFTMPKVTIESTSNQDNVQNCLKFIKKKFKKIYKTFYAFRRTKL